MSDIQTKDEWLAVRLAEGKLIDPQTAEVFKTWGDVGDPYGLCPDLSESCIGKIFFARRPDSDVCVYLGDLPAAVYEALWNRFLAGEADVSPTSFRSSYTLAAALRRAAVAYKEQTQHHDDGDWASWYAKYLAKEQADAPF
jgi:hypothetical protein